MIYGEEVLRTLAAEIGARPTGTEANEAANAYLEDTARELGYEVTALSFDCKRWEFGDSGVRAGGRRAAIHPGPFSAPLDRDLPVAMVATEEELRSRDVAGHLLVIRGELAGEPLMPRDFPFYFPDEHAEFLDLLSQKQPAAVLAMTGRHPLCGLSPFPLFEDGNLGIPNAYAQDPDGVLAAADRAHIQLDSASLLTTGRQLVFSRPAGPAGSAVPLRSGRPPAPGHAGTEARAGRLVVTAHVDTKYETPGALDNAAGVATLMAVMERLRDVELSLDVDFVPLNGEEHYEVSGQLAYLAHRPPSPDTTQLVVNLDGLGHRDSATAFSFYNFDSEVPGALSEPIEAAPRMTTGEQWYAGDHAVFAFRGIRCIAVTSSNLMEEVIRLTHTQQDTVELVDGDLLEETASVVAEILTRFGRD